MNKTGKLIVRFDSISGLLMLLMTSCVLVFNYTDKGLLGIPGYLWVNILISGFIALQVVITLMNGSRIRWSKVYNYSVLFILLCFLSTFYSFAPDASLDRTRRMIIMVVLSVCIYQYSSMSIENLIFALKSFSWAGFFGAIYLLMGSNLGQRLGSLIGDANLVGITFSFAASIAIYIFKTEYKIAYLVQVIIIAFTVLMTGSRTSMGLLITAIVGNIYLIAYQKKWKMRYVILITIGVIAGLLGFLYALMNVPILYDVLGMRVLSFYQIIHGQASVYGETSTQFRAIYAMRGFKWFLESPIWGNGINAYPAYNATFADGRFCFSHCEYAEILSGRGILGFIAYFFPYFKMGASAMRRGCSAESKELKVLLLTLIAELILGSIFLVMYYEKPTWILIALMTSIMEMTQNEYTGKEKDIGCSQQ